MKLLLVGEDPRDALSIREALAQAGEDDFRLEHAESLSRGLERARSDSFDVLLLTLGPEGDGIAPLVQVRRKAPDVPVLVLVRPGDEELARLAVKEGAQDWLVKARIDGDSLPRAIRYSMERAHLSQELASVRAQLNNLTLRDELTGLYNRRGFSVLAEQQMRLARRWDAGLLLLVIDVDGLDSINERFGRAAGDRALVETGQLMRESFRDSDIKARIGGDEFVVLLSGAADGTCEVIDQRLTQNIERLNAQSDRPCPLSVSGGVARWDPSTGQGVADVLDKAEHLMHEQKRGTVGKIDCGGA